MIGRLLLGKPRIVIEEAISAQFEPSRTIWQIQISNIKLKRWQDMLFLKRSDLECWVEALFIIGDEIPQLASDKAAWASWREDDHLILKPTSIPYTLELVSKIYGENGFHIKTPTLDTLMTDNDALVYVLVKTGQDDIFARGVWALSSDGDLHLERLE